MFQIILSMRRRLQIQSIPYLGYLEIHQLKGQAFKQMLDLSHILVNTLAVYWVKYSRQFAVNLSVE